MQSVTGTAIYMYSLSEAALKRCSYGICNTQNTQGNHTYVLRLQLKDSVVLFASCPFYMCSEIHGGILLRLGSKCSVQ